MTLLTVWKETDPSTPVLETTEESEIRAALAELGARFSRWEVKDVAPAPRRTRCSPCTPTRSAR